MTHHITDERLAEVLTEAYGSPEWTMADVRAARAVEAAVLALAASQGEPFGYFRALPFGWEDCAAGDEGAIALYTAPAPAVPSDVLSEMREFGKAKMAEFMGAHHMALVLSQKIKEWADKLTAAPTPPAQPAVPEDVGSGLPSDPVAWRWFNSNGPVGDWRPLRPGKRSEIESQVADAGGRIEYACVQASPAVPESADPFLVRDIADMIGSSVPDVCKALVELGYPQRSTNMEIPRQEAVAVAERLRPAVPEDVAREPMTQKWCWWLGDAETFHVADTESEAHGEAQSRIDDDCEPGDTREYSVGRVQHPIDALGMDWLAEHAAETIEENACCWCDDNTGAEDPSITLAAEDKAALGKMVAAFLREKVSVHWWTADQATITTHSYVAGSNGDAARAAENPRLNGAARRPLRTDG